MKKIDIIRLHSTDKLATILNYFARGDYCNYSILSQKCVCRQKNDDFIDSNCVECIKKWLLEKYNYDLVLLANGSTKSNG